MRRQTIIAMAAGLLTSACSSGGSAPVSTSSQAKDTYVPYIPNDVPTPDGTVVVPTPAPTLAITSAPPPSPETLAITGFGATDADWAGAHTQDTNYAAGSAYDPDPSLPQVNGRMADVYYGVDHSNGRVTGYEMRLHLRTGISAAKRVALHEFPSDTRIAWYQVVGAECVQMEVASPTLGQALSSEGDSQGLALVEFGTLAADGSSGFDPSNVNDALFELLVYATAADAAGC